MKITTMTSILSTTLAVGLLVSAMPLFADTTPAPATTPQQRQAWRQSHPARAKDNARIRNQRKLLNQDLKSGKITKDQYDSKMKELSTIKKEERVDAKANDNGGHLTGGQQQAINQQLNENHKDINQDVKTDKTAP